MKLDRKYKSHRESDTYSFSGRLGLADIKRILLYNCEGLTGEETEEIEEPLRNYEKPFRGILAPFAGEDVVTWALDTAIRKGFLLSRDNGKTYYINASKLLKERPGTPKENLMNAIIRSKIFC